VVGTHIGLAKAGSGSVAEIVRLGVPDVDLRLGAFAGLAGNVPGGLGLGVGGGLGDVVGVGGGLGEVVGPGLGEFVGFGLGLVHFVFPSGAANIT